MRFRIGLRGSRLGGVEDQLDFAVLDGIDHMRAAFEHLVDLGGGNALVLEIALGAAGRHDG